MSRYRRRQARDLRARPAVSSPAVARRNMPAAGRRVPDRSGSVGHPLDPTMRADMEARFGHRLDAVRIFTDDRAAASAQMLGARAYTIGDTIVFGAGSYAPQAPEGRRLLAHELAHVVQQSDVSIGTGELTVDPPTSAAEREADRAADSVAAGASAAPIEARHSAPVISESAPEGAGAGATP